MHLSIYTDGGSRGNPGPSGFGVVIFDSSKKLLAQISKFVCIKTNNEAEYLALIEALTWVSDHRLDVSSVKIFSDSQLLVRQLNGKYKVKAANIKPLYQTAIAVISSLHLPLTFHEIPRESNSLADDLANKAMDLKVDTSADLSAGALAKADELANQAMDQKNNEKFRKQ